MKLSKINPKNFFRSKKNRSSVSRTEQSSFGSGTTSSSSSSDISSSNAKPGAGSGAPDVGTPTSVLPQVSGDWSDMSVDMSFEILQAFKLIDRDNDGIVTQKDLEALLTRLGAEPPSQEEVMLMLREVGCDSDGCITLESLMNRVGSACGPACNAELRETFDLFDTDHDGKITAEELLRVFKAIGDGRCTLEECKRMIAEVDRNKDGFVCFEDFSRMMDVQR